MGGCRCTYRNCRVKSDGKTHMFHYPVFEKVRCHQWLINAHRLDFLNLKVSQVKNRVVCQHHFKDENFMNFTKGKLTFDAIPTEDGPYCDTTNYVAQNQDPSKLYCIIVDDIEDDIGCDKKAKNSMKYGDFLSNLDVMDMEKTQQDSITYKHETNNLDTLLTNEQNDKLNNDDRSFVFKLSLPAKCDKKPQPMLAVSPYVNSKIVTQGTTDKKYLVEQSVGKSIFSNDKQGILTGEQSVSKSIFLNDKQGILTCKEEEKIVPTEQKVVREKPKITIISEKKITTALPITGKFEPVSPNFVLNASNIRRDRANIPKPSLNEQSKIQPVNNKERIIQQINQPEASRKECIQQELPLQELSVPDKTIEIEIEPINIKEEVKVEQPTSIVNMQSNVVSQKPSKVSLLKPKVPPERLEAINKKRQFNMKLRDIIESCLDKLENSDKTSEESIAVDSKPKSKRDPYQNTKNLSKESPALTTPDYTIAFLDARIKKMENTLLEKLEQNSEKINDIKQICSSKKPTIPTKADEEAHKKYLFQEISKYLSPSSKSLIYEELFINKFAVSDTNISPKRKRRR